jgi:rod shape-determining protein MreB
MREYGMAFKVEKRKGTIAGVDMKTGLPVHVDITSDQVMSAIREPVSLIVSDLRRLLDSVPPDLAADALEDGLNLTGGGSLLNGLAELLFDQTGIQCAYVDDPLTAVALGCGAIVEDLDLYKFILESLPEEIAGMA